MLSIKFSKLRASLQAELRNHRVFYLLLAVLLAAAIFLRVYRTGQVLWFFFDQGRDALVVHDFLHGGKLFLVGPTTGIAGIFRGPFYYYLIAPFYFLGQGSPVWPANFLSLSTVFAIAVVYFLAKEAVSRTAGFFAVFVSSLSFFMISDSRWLSNPTPMFLLSAILLFFMFLVIDGKKTAWVAIALTSGLSLFHFGSSGEFFYFPALLVLLISQRKKLPGARIIFLSIFVFFLTASPLVLFDLRHDGILSSNIHDFILRRGSFQTSFYDVLQERLVFYKDTFIKILFPSANNANILLAGIMGIYFFRYLGRLVKNSKARLVLIFLISPLIGLLFFQGNEGNLFGYYLTGYVMFFVFILGVILSYIWKSGVIGKFFAIIFIIIFITSNVPLTFSRIRDNVDGPTTVALGNQKQAVEWVYNNANGLLFNTDFYVPPAIPHSYNYLFGWYDSMQVYNGWTEGKEETLLYTVYEVDPPHPERLEAWLKRQDGIGKVEEEIRFGGITAQRRTRLD